MKFAADVAHQSVRRADEDHFTVVPVEAATLADAARKVAEIAAVRRFEDGNVGFLSPTSTMGYFRASIGVQKRSDDGITLAGVTITIHVWPVE
jgi:hypothetical protein